MKKIFWIFFITCFIGSCLNIAYINSKKLSHPYLFEDVHFATHYDNIYKTLSIPYLTNRYDTTHIQYIILDQHYLYPTQDMFHFFQQQPSNPQHHEEYSLYNLNFANFNLDETIVTYLKTSGKTFYDADVHFSNGHQAKQQITVNILNSNRDIIVSGSGYTYSSGYHEDVWRVKDDIVITNIYDTNNPFVGSIKTQYDEITREQLPIEIIKGELLYINYQAVTTKVPKNMFYNDYLVIEGYKKYTDEPFLAAIPFQTSQIYENDYFINYLKDKELN